MYHKHVLFIHKFYEEIYLILCDMYNKTRAIHTQLWMHLLLSVHMQEIKLLKLFKLKVKKYPWILTIGCTTLYN